MKLKSSSLASPCLFSKPLLGTIQMAYAIILLGLFSIQAAHSQGTLSVGDKVPDITVGNVINHSSSSISLSDFKGQLIILDFWATWCSPCIAMFPKTDYLQKVFKDQVRFLPVTYEDKEKVEKLFKRSDKLKGVTLPIAFSDTTLHAMFPHHELPHYVWIDGTGTVKAITGYQEVTAEKIRGMLAAAPVSLKEKRDVRLSYDREKPLLLNNLGITRSVMYYETLLTVYMEGLSTRSDILRYDDGSYARITVTNAPYQKLYALAYSSPQLYIERNRILVEVKDPSKVIMAGSENASREIIRQWLQENSFCYEIMVPPHLSSSIFKLMQQDLARLFPQYQASLEKRKVKCFVLERTSGTDKIRTRGEPVSFSFGHYEASMTNCSLALLLSQLNGVNLQHLNTPIVDGTGYSGKVDLKLDCTLSDPESLRKALKAYDLDLVAKEKTIDMLIIRDSK